MLIGLLDICKASNPIRKVAIQRVIQAVMETDRLSPSSQRSIILATSIRARSSTYTTTTTPAPGPQMKSVAHTAWMTRPTLASLRIESNKH